MSLRLIAVDVRGDARPAARPQAAGLRRSALACSSSACSTASPSAVAEASPARGEVALIADDVEMAGPTARSKHASPRRSSRAPRHAHRPRPRRRGHARAATAAARGRRGLILSVGSGTIADIGKVVSARLGLPHVVVQTAASVNGFSDDQSVLLVDGVKRTTPRAGRSGC